ncbi:hypothetical protein [Pseudobutyrivibrio sp.]|uniref:hypothetical protein n=1 Tax=Pseudobutyrivibrio sp. TaxID=2014367 RepID=UPI0025FDC0EA|nr:hypothetical protein [Pseudobutyrivibrio sp.]MBR5650326.1 hypothetical protein [Pseudobutyrivibrio sp.]
MKKKFFSLMLVAAMAFSMVACGADKEADASAETVVETVEEPAEESVEEPEVAKLDLEDGEYTVDFTTDSSMFHINETLNNKATLTVEDGVGTVHITLAGTGIINLYVGLAADAESDEANWLNYTEDEVTYDDGMTETVYGFDVPVSVLNEEFDLALLGTKGTWYDHKVKVTYEAN